MFYLCTVTLAEGVFLGKKEDAFGFFLCRTMAETPFKFNDPLNFITWISFVFIAQEFSFKLLVDAN